MTKSAPEGKRKEDDKSRNEGVSSTDNIGHTGEKYGASEEGQGVGQGDPIDIPEVIELLADSIKTGCDDG